MYNATIFCRSALWLQGNPGLAKGVVVFMHGFSQSPLAYYLMLQAVVDQGLLVVAPAPPNATKPDVLQVNSLSC